MRLFCAQIGSFNHRHPTLSQSRETAGNRKFELLADGFHFHGAGRQSRGKVCKRPVGAFMNTPLTDWKRPHTLPLGQVKGRRPPACPCGVASETGGVGASPRMGDM